MPGKENPLADAMPQHLEPTWEKCSVAFLYIYHCRSQMHARDMRCLVEKCCVVVVVVASAHLKLAPLFLPPFDIVRGRLSPQRGARTSGRIRPPAQRPASGLSPQRGTRTSGLLNRQMRSFW